MNHVTHNTENEYEALIKLFDELIHEAEREMYYKINFDSKDIRISAPKFIINLFFEALSKQYNGSAYYTNGRLGKDFIYRGITFLPHFEMEIVVWHIDYPLFKEDWMIRKIPLNPTYKIPKHLSHNSRCTEYIIKIAPIIENYNPNYKEGSN